MAAIIELFIGILMINLCDTAHLRNATFSTIIFLRIKKETDVRGKDKKQAVSEDVQRSGPL